MTATLDQKLAHSSLVVALVWKKKKKLSVMPCMINSVTIQVQLEPFQNARNI